MRAITICVDYADLLAVTLPWNRHNFTEWMIVTTPEDQQTIQLASEHSCQVYTTRSFYDNGAHFNKYLAMEEGFDVLGREGWLCILDADVLIPKGVDHTHYRIGNLYGPRRRMLQDPTGNIQKKINKPWIGYKIDGFVAQFPGYCQIFNVDDPRLGPPPWHETDWKHCAGGDARFQDKWEHRHKIRTPWEVLHLGPKDVNWCGRSSHYVDGTVPQNSKELRDLSKAAVLNTANPDRSADKINVQSNPSLR